MPVTGSGIGWAPGATTEQMSEWLIGLFSPILPGTAAIGLKTAEQIAAEEPYAMPPKADTDEKGVKLGFLGGTALILGGIVLAPTLYRAAMGTSRGKRRLGDREIAESLDYASNRATSLAAGLLPAFAFPIAYIGVQELEQRGVITKGLGNAVQGLMTAGVVAPAIGNIVGGVLKAVVSAPLKAVK